VPLSLAVGFSMVFSYLLSSTLVPVLSVWLLRHAPSAEKSAPFFDRVRQRYAALLQRLLPWRWVFLGGYLLVAVALSGWWLLGHPGVGMEIFPTVDAGQFQIRLRAPTGTHLDRTEQLTQKALEVIKDHVGEENLSISVCYVGTVPANYPINNVYLWTSGPEEVVMRIALKEGSGLRVADLREELREVLPRRLKPWLRDRLQAVGLSPEAADKRADKLRLSFEPADIINEVMSFGSPTPVEIAVSGPRLPESRAFAEKIRAQLTDIPSLRDLHFQQPPDYPTVDVRADRERLGRLGGSIKGMTDSVLPATSSSRYVVPLYWPDPNSGIGFQVQVEVPMERMRSLKDVSVIRLDSTTGEPALRLGYAASVKRGTMPGEIDRYNMRRLISLTANIEGEDLGRVAGRIDEALKVVGGPPKGAELDVRGQVVPMQQMFRDLALGLLLAVVVIFLLLTGYFQSPRLALLVILTAPAVIAGVVLALFVTGTTLNIQSFMGAIMAIGVAVANSILLVTFAEKVRVGERSMDHSERPAGEAAVEGAQARLRPILMTSCAMIAGMVPMALALGEGGEQTASLARAVIGGLGMATVATLLLLPMLFTVIQSRASRESPSLDPEDPESVHFTKLQAESPQPRPEVSS
jgi:multidrug efflux pump subunit AcrB